MKDPVVFVMSVTLLLMTPGPTNTLLAASGALIGVYRSVRLLIAEVTGYLTSILTIGYLLGNWMTGAPRFTTALRISSGVYLLTLAVRTWRAYQGVSPEAPSFSRVLVTTLLNPKALIFALVIIPAREPNAVLYFAAFSLIVPTIGCIWIAFGGVTRRAVGLGYVRLVPKITSVVLACFSVSLIIKTVLG
jgi:threonine/homoserine/homoserine lactone efflux protein